MAGQVRDREMGDGEEGGGEGGGFGEERVLQGAGLPGTKP